MMYVLSYETRYGKSYILGMSPELDDCFKAAEQFFTADAERLRRYQAQWGDLCDEAPFENGLKWDVVEDDTSKLYIAYLLLNDHLNISQYDVGVFGDGSNW